MSDINTILKLNVPVIVRLGHRRMPLGDVLKLTPGSIVELAKSADAPLDLMVNNCQIGTGNAVKVGEQFGLSVLSVGDAEAKIRALGGQGSAGAMSTPEPPEGASQEGDDAEVENTDTSELDAVADAMDAKEE